MQTITFIQDLAIVMTVAALVSVVFHRYNQPRVIGYILAGLIIGPHTPPFSFIHDEASIQTLADLGVMFLMFSLGLEFNLRKISKVGVPAAVTATLDVLIMVWIGYSIGRLLGWGRVESLFLGAIICDSSTTILAKVVSDLGWARKRFAELMFGITIVEDLLAVVLIALLNGLSVGSFQAAAVMDRAFQLLVFLIVVLVLGLLFVPRLLGVLEKYKSDELLLITVLGLCFGVCLVAMKLELSLALGAFLVGAITAEARGIARIEQLVAPLRHMFSAVFFVTVGLMIQPALLWQHYPAILLVTLVVVVAKVVNCTAGAVLAGEAPGVAFRAGLGMAQIGEFAYIIAAMGVMLGITDAYLYQVAVAVSLLTTMLSPYLLRSSDALAAALKKRMSPGFFAALDLYGSWIARLSALRGSNVILAVVRRSALIVLVNLALIAAVFLGGAFVAGRKDVLFPAFELWAGAGSVCIWLACALLALPLFVSSLRKIQALGMILSEICISPALATPWAQRLRSLITHAFLLIGILGLVVLVFMLSSTLLPSWKELAVLLVVMALVMRMRWRRLISVYARAQASIQDLFARDMPSSATPAMQSLLSVHLQTVELSTRARAVGQRLLDLQLRAKTGVNAVSIERGSGTIVNPNPDEIFVAGDRVLLLGTPEQIAQAMQLMK